MTGRALRAVEGVLPMFDLTLPHRITLHGFFVARYGRGGRCDDLLGLVHDFHEDVFDQYVSFTAKRTAFDENGEYVPEENWLVGPSCGASTRPVAASSPGCARCGRTTGRTTSCGFPPSCSPPCRSDWSRS